MIDLLKLLHDLAEAKRRLDETVKTPRIGAPPPRAAQPQLFGPVFGPEQFALLLAMKMLTGRMLSLIAAKEEYPEAWLKSERALFDLVLDPGGLSDEDGRLLAPVRKQIDALFEEARTGLLNPANYKPPPAH